jgi:hypothetical protein
MSVSMSALSVPAFVQGLEALAITLEKAEAYAAAKTIDEAALLQSRLFPDMFPMVRQVQIATDTAKGAVARLGGQAVPSFPDDETSFAALRARVDRTIDFVKSVPAAAIDGSEAKEVSVKGRSSTMTFKGQDYLLSFALPNFYFHLATAYGLLRQAGLDIGKRDFLGAVRMS